jgi:hypothetical protein
MSVCRRTQEEILEKIRTEKENDILGFYIPFLMDYLDFENVKPFLNKDYLQKIEEGKERWEKHTDPEKDIWDYMKFAWEKANGCRGISAERSLEHFRAWLWLDGEDGLAELMENHTHYGKPQLVAISKRYAIDWKSLDNDEWKNHENQEPKTAKGVLGVMYD